jgi:predicted anti-sigma-YlaC factor YlaD
MDAMCTGRRSGTRWSYAAVLLGAAALSGCSMQRLVVNHVGDALARGGGVYASDDDLELVGAAVPFGLKLTESLLAASPQHRGLLLSLASGFTQYAYAYVELPAEQLDDHDVAAAYAQRERARRLYLRARDYGMRGLEAAHAGFRQQFDGDAAPALARLDRGDVPLMYWTAAAWGAAIALGKDDPHALAGLASMKRLADRAMALEDSYDAGALHTLFISLAMSESLPDAERTANARAHLARALELSDRRQAAPFVTFAEAVCVPTGDRAGFDAMLANALAVDVRSAPERRLANELFQQRARTLRARVDELFTQ